MGFLAEQVGYDRAWMFFAAVAVVGGLIVLSARRLLEGTT
jgi:hypothetical protein